MGMVFRFYGELGKTSEFESAAVAAPQAGSQREIPL
jgi:hypothetical protein